MIDDPELRSLFKAESEEHLQTLENGLLRLEAEPRAGTVLEELFRSAHSLKGAARMLGIGDLETLAHHFEDELDAARRGRSAMSSAVADRLYRGLDAMRQLTREACGDEAAPVDMTRILAQLRGEEPPSAPEPVNGASAGGSPGDTEVVSSPGPTGVLPENDVPAASRAEPSVTQIQPPVPLTTDDAPVPRDPERAGPVPGPPVPVPSETPAVLNGGLPMATDEPHEPASNPPVVVDGHRPAAGDPDAAADESQALASPTAFKVETIRVEPQKLDALMTLAGEMTVTTARVARAMAVVGDLTALWEEWSRDITTLRAAQAVSADGRPDDAVNGAGKHVARFHERETQRVERMGNLLDRLAQSSDEGITRLGLVAGEMDEAIGGMRQLPFSTIFSLFPRLVRDLSREQGKEVQLIVEGGAVTADKHLLEEMKDPLMHMLRNAVDHGIELPEERVRLGKPQSATLRLRAYQTASAVVIEVADDGKGLDIQGIRDAALRKRVHTAEEIAALSPEEARMLIFAPGFSTSTLITDVSGRGVGLDVVRANVERLKGTIAVESVPGRGCTFRLKTPITLATTRVLLVQVAGRSYALPIEAVLEIVSVSPDAVFSIEGRPAIRRENQPVAAAQLADLLELPFADKAARTGKERQAQGPPDRPCVLLSVGAERLGLFVDGLSDEQEVVLKPFGGLLQRVRNVSGSTILSTGEICMVLNPRDLVKSAKGRPTVTSAAEPGEESNRRKALLFAEDSITTRTQIRRILESAGYEVVTAVDGADALSKLELRPYDAVVSDIEMPNMDGLTLAARIRGNAKYTELPIILVTSLASEEDRQRGVEAGANAYITKSAFEQTVLLDTLRRLV